MLERCLRTVLQQRLAWTRPKSISCSNDLTYEWSRRSDLNRRPADYESGGLGRLVACRESVHGAVARQQAAAALEVEDDVAEIGSVAGRMSGTRVEPEAS